VKRDELTDVRLVLDDERPERSLRVPRVPWHGHLLSHITRSRPVRRGTFVAEQWQEGEELVTPRIPANAADIIAVISSRHDCSHTWRF
jgi:hypothetical protein